MHLCTVCLCTCVYAPLCAHRGQRRACFLFYPSLPYSFEAGSLTEPRARLTAVSIPFPTSAGISGTKVSILFWGCSGDLNGSLSVPEQHHVTKQWGGSRMGRSVLNCRYGENKELKGDFWSKCHLKTLVSA